MKKPTLSRLLETREWGESERAIVTGLLYELSQTPSEKATSRLLMDLTSQLDQLASGFADLVNQVEGLEREPPPLDIDEHSPARWHRSEED